MISKWNKFFYEPISPASLGVFRILIGAVTILSVLGKFPYRNIFYGDEGIISYEVMSKYLPDIPWLYFRWLPGADPGLMIYFVGLLIACVMLSLGFLSRTSSVVVFLGMISLSNRNMFIENNGDNFLRINLFFLMFAPSGAAYSIDRWMLRRQGKAGEQLEPVAPWAQRLLQLQLCYLYFETAWTKLPGQSWKDGTAIFYALNYLELRRLDITWMFDSVWKIKAATYSTVVLEFAIPTLMWLRRCRYPILISAMALHFTLNLVMQFPVFQYVMIASLVNFVYPEDIEKIVGRVWGFFRPSGY